MVEYAFHDADISISVANGILRKFNLVGAHTYYGLGESIDCVQRFDAYGAVGHKLTREVDVAQRTEQAYLSVGMRIDIVHEAATKTLQKLEAGVSSSDA